MIDRTADGREARFNEAVLHIHDLSELAKALHIEPVWDEHGRNGTTLVKSGSIRVVLEVLRKDAHLSEHKAPGNATIHLLEGEIRFTSGDQVVYLTPGHLLVMPQGLPHSVEAVRDSIFLLTFASV